LDHYEAVIVGGGPAGLMAAKKAAENGAQVLLLEKESYFGRKVCAGGITKQTLVDSEISESPDFIENEILGACVHGPDARKEIMIDADSIGLGKGYIIDKPNFLREMAEAAESKGAEIMLNSAVSSVVRRDNAVVVTTQREEDSCEIACKILVGCDGFGSLVAKSFGFAGEVEMMSCIQYVMGNCDLQDEHSIEIYLGRMTAPLGYLWIFPKGKEIANVGVSVRGTNPKEMLDKFIAGDKRLRDSEILKIGSAPIVTSGQLRNVVLDNLMICGESAGQVIPLTAAGIHTALIAGKIAGEVCARAIEENDFSKRRLYAYADSYHLAYGRQIENSLKVTGIYKRLDDNDLNRLIEVLSAKDLADLASGLDLGRIVEMLLKHPLLSSRVFGLLFQEAL
jgi:digeranylgeranylglycerophospholipid reductase